MKNENEQTIVDKMVEIKLKKEEDFLKVKETLSRIGIASKKSNTLYQSCHILHKKSKYFICHFKELFLLDGKESNFTVEDIGRRNRIATLLEDWDLVEIVNPNKVNEPLAPVSSIKILPYKEKKNWILTPKYSIGNKNGYSNNTTN